MPFIGKVWPGNASYPDYMHASTGDWWKNLVDHFQQRVEFDGLWLDMNEASNFCDGVCFEFQASNDTVVDKLPYTPSGRSLQEKSIDVDAVHILPDGTVVSELDAHNTFSTLQTKATHEWFQEANKRTMIIARSSFPGQGNHASRWLGDNFASEEMMGYSVTGVMMSNILGITLAGSDICGFIGNTTADLCARWHLVGAFYPFSRNHNTNDANSQEPWVWLDDEYEGGTSYMDIMQGAINLKYTMVPYYYSQIHSISRGEAATLMRPLFFEFPNDP